MNSPSEEQLLVISSIEEGSNVIVDACAGSGKSTTILSCAHMLPQYKFIQLTFNKQLQTEVQDKVKSMQLRNIDVFTFHGLAVKYYHSSCHNDMGIRRILRQELPARMEIPEYDIIVLDETQDMTKVFFDLIWKFGMEMGRQVQFLILGDEKQGLYGFKGSDTRFLTLADACWKQYPLLKTPDFCHHTLKMSYRITDEMRFFLNKIMLGEERVKSCKPGVPVVYMRRPFFRKYDGHYILYNMMQTLIKNENAAYEDFFILCRSLKSSNRMSRKMENMLVEENIPVYIASSDAKEEIDARVIQNKVVFSTFHAAKGRQRKYVIVLGFDDSHFTQFARDKDPKICPNELYVACTRATKKLIVWEDIGRKKFQLPFLKYSHNQMIQTKFVSFNGIPSGRQPQSLPDSAEEEIQKRVVHPSELIRFLSETTLDVISPLVDSIFTTIREANEMPVEIPNVHETRTGHCEDVSDLNGNVIPLIYFDRLRHQHEPVLQQLISQYMKEMSPDEHPLFQEAVKTMPEVCETADDYLYLANLLSAIQDLLYSRFKQIGRDEYTWLSSDVLDPCFALLDEVVKPDCIDSQWNSEQYIIRSGEELEHCHIDACMAEFMKGENVVYRFSARADLITENSLWELKCTSQLSLDHKLQLVLYAWLHQMKYSPQPTPSLKYYLYNIKTNEWLQLEASLDQLTQIVTEIMKGKYSKPVELSDEEFLAQFENPSLTPIHEGDDETKDGEDESKDEKINIE
jgi:hypothetical protein